MNDDKHYFSYAKHSANDDVQRTPLECLISAFERCIFMLVDNIIKEFLLNCTIQNYFPRTIKSYRNNLERFFSFVTETELEKITSVIIKEQIMGFQQRGLKPSYINSIIKTLRAFYTYVLDQEYISVNPMKKVPWCRERLTIIKAFTDDEVKRMMSVYTEKEFTGSSVN